MTKSVDNLYENRKTRLLYELVARGRDRTNARDGTRVAIYRSVDNFNSWYVRDEAEFEVKFRRVE